MMFGMSTTHSLDTTQIISSCLVLATTLIPTRNYFVLYVSQENTECSIFYFGRGGEFFNPCFYLQI